MQLQQVAKTVVSEGDSTIAINGIDSDDVYLLVGTHIISTQSNCELFIRVNDLHKIPHLLYISILHFKRFFK